MSAFHFALGSPPPDGPLAIVGAGGNHDTPSISVPLLILRGVQPDDDEQPNTAESATRCCATVQDKMGPRRCRNPRTSGTPPKPFTHLTPKSREHPVPFCKYHWEHVWLPVVQYYKRVGVTAEEELHARQFLDDEMLKYEVEPNPTYKEHYELLRAKIRDRVVPPPAAAATRRPPTVRPTPPANLFETLENIDLEASVTSAARVVYDKDAELSEEGLPRWFETYVDFKEQLADTLDSNEFDRPDYELSRFHTAMWSCLKSGGRASRDFKNIRRDYDTIYEAKLRTLKRIYFQSKYMERELAAKSDHDFGTALCFPQDPGSESWATVFRRSLDECITLKNVFYSSVFIFENHRKSLKDIRKKHLKSMLFLLNVEKSVSSGKKSDFGLAAIENEFPPLVVDQVERCVAAAYFYTEELRRIFRLNSHSKLVTMYNRPNANDTSLDEKIQKYILQVCMTSPNSDVMVNGYNKWINMPENERANKTYFDVMLELRNENNRGPVGWVWAAIFTMLTVFEERT